MVRDTKQINSYDDMTKVKQNLKVVVKLKHVNQYAIQ